MWAEFTDSEWSTLRFMPWWVLSAIAGRDRRFDPMDRDVLVESLVLGAQESTGSFTRAVLEDCAASAPQIWATFEGDARSIGTGLDDVEVVLSRVSPTDAAEFRRSGIRIGLRLACARGPYGKSATIEDQQRLLLVDSLMSPVGGLDAALRGAA